jgi:hypothetical protein
MATRSTEVRVDTVALGVDIDRDGTRDERLNVPTTLKPNEDRSEVAFAFGPVTARFNVVELRAALKLATDP